MTKALALPRLTSGSEREWLLSSLVNANYEISSGTWKALVTVITPATNSDHDDDHDDDDGNHDDDDDENHHDDDGHDDDDDHHSHRLRVAIPRQSVQKMGHDDLRSVLWCDDLLAFS